MSFHAKHLGYSYGLAEATFELPSTGLLAVVGPNGAGKSTLISILAGLRRPYKGSCLYEGKEVRDWRRPAFARQVTFLPQFVRVEFPFTAEQIVFMGRTPHSNGWYDSPEDRTAVDRALEITDAGAFRDRDFRTLSGGERQRVILASALAQEPRVLLLDEPATFLDLKHQVAMYRLLATLAGQLLIVAVTHDLNLTLRYAHHVLVLDKGRVAAAGAAPQVLTADLITRVFQVQATVDAGWLKVQYDA